jgi:hypothetical protein
MANRNANLATISFLYGTDSDAGREFLAEVINDNGGLNILSDEIIEKLAERHVARSEWEMRAFAARNRAA